MKQRLIALALCLVMGLGLAAPSFAVQADAPGGLDGAEPDLWDILAPNAPGGLDSEEPSLPAPDEPAQLDTPVQELPEKDPDLTQAGENAPAASCLYCGAAGDVHADFCPLYVPAEGTDEPAPPAELAPAPSARPAEPTVALETVLEQPPAQAVRTLSAEQPGILSDDQRFLAFSTLQRPRFAESKGTDGETPEPVDNPGVETKKAVTGNKDGTYTVEIESYVTGRTITTETAAPVDIILVLDMSREMAKDGYLEAMKDAANEFIRKARSEKGERRIALVTYQNDSGTVISGNRNTNKGALVSVTTGDGETKLIKAVNDLTGPDGNAYCQYGLARATQIFQSYEKEVPRYVLLLSAGVFGNGTLTSKATVKSAQITLNVSTVLKTAAGTTPQVDWKQAFYESGPVSKDTTVGNLGTGHAVDWDKGCGADVYCVGLNMPIQKKDGKEFIKWEYSVTDNENSWYKDDDYDVIEDSKNMAGYGNTAARINEAMYRICSDRPDSTHVTSSKLYNSWEEDAFLVSNPTGNATYYIYTTKYDWLGNPSSSWVVQSRGKGNIDWSGTYPDWATRDQKGGHFLTGTTETIAEKFATIFQNIQTSNPAPSVTLDKNSVLVDVVMPYFEVPEGPEGKVSIDAKVVNVATGQEDADLSKQLIVEYDSNKTDGTSSVSVKGFDYTKNFVSADGKSGKKLVLTFTIQPIQGFMGGNGVPTNNVTKSGVFAKGELVENLPDPGTQTVPLADIKLTVPDKSIYLSQTLTETALLEGAKVTLEDGTVLPLTEDEQKNNWRFDFVTLTVAAGAPYTGEWTDCTEVPVTATLAAKDGNATPSTATAEPTVHVFRPTVHVTANDVWADYGESIDLKTWCVTQNETTWAHNCGDDAVKLSGAAPEISISDYPFNLVGKNGVYSLITNGRYLTTEDDVNCVIGVFTYTVGGKSYTGLSSNVTYPAGGHFTIHINRFDLTVSKTWTGADCYKQSAIFNLSTGDNKAMATQFTLSPETGKSSTTVHGLVCGKTYALSEDMDWSWRYHSSPIGAVTVEKNNEISKTAPTIDPAQVSFTNTLTNSFWFDAASFVSNLFKGKGA